MIFLGLSLIFLYLPIFLFYNSVEILMLFQLTILLFLATFSSRVFILVYISFLLSYRFFLPLFNMDPLYELIPIVINLCLFPLFLFKKKDISVDSDSLIFKILKPILLIIFSISISSFINQTPFFEFIRQSLWIISPLFFLIYIYFADIDHKDIFKKIIKILLIFFLNSITNSNSPKHTW